MRLREARPVLMVASVHRHAMLFKETVVPWQTLSALSWLLAGVLCCNGPIRVFSDWSFLIMIMAITTARFSGMCWNRLIDWQIDARNPRTARRAGPCGRLSQKELAAYALLTLALFLLSCFFFAPVGRLIGIGVAILVLFYSFTKRFTIGCHFVLGMIHALLPIAGSLWQNGTISVPAALLSLAAFATVSGTDILYAVQDEVFDRRFGLFSIPARFGTARAVETASLLHVVAFIAVSLAFVNMNMSTVVLFPWAMCMAFLLNVWHGVWEQPMVRLGKAFPLFFVGFAVLVCLILAMDRAWNAL